MTSIEDPWTSEGRVSHTDLWPSMSSFHTVHYLPSFNEHSLYIFLSICLRTQQGISPTHRKINRTQRRLFNSVAAVWLEFRSFVWILHETYGHLTSLAIWNGQTLTANNSSSLRTQVHHKTRHIGMRTLAPVCSMTANCMMICHKEPNKKHHHKHRFWKSHQGTRLTRMFQYSWMTRFAICYLFIYKRADSDILTVSCRDKKIWLFNHSWGQLYQQKGRS